MKLDYKKTVYVGLAFFIISLFWQAYDSIVPKILVEQFGMDQTASGIIMALDNILALFLLPLFGSISDRSKSRYGRRTPFIVVGTVLAAVLFVASSFADNAQLFRLNEMKDPETAHEILWELDPEIPGKGSLQSQITKEEFFEIRLDGTKLADGETVTDPAYNDYFVPARQAYAWKQTMENPVTLVFFMILLIAVLLSMSVFRSPAVALMPDVTPKPLRSKANAVINLMGAAGGIIVLILGMVFGTGKVTNSLMSYTAFFAVIAAIMLLALMVFLWKVREPKLVRQAEEESEKYGVRDEKEETRTETKLDKGQKISLAFLLASVVLWFMGYNAVTSKFSVYAGAVLSKDFNSTLIVAQAAAIVAFIPIGLLSSKIGRKKTILGGIVLLAGAFVGAVFVRADTSPVFMYLLFAMAGIGWASINVNSYPMVVELAKGSNVGKYTGYYYTASMAAQIATPILSGALMDRFGMTALFPYGAVCVALAIVTMLFVMHGDNKPQKTGTLESFADSDLNE